MKYQRLLEGLEVSEILLSQVLTASYSGRIDSTFFLKEYLNHESFEFSYKLNQIANIKSGTTPADRDDDLKEGVMLLKTNNIRNNIINKYYDINYFIYEEVNKKMKSSELKEYDVLVNIVGATLDVVGRVGYVTNSLPKSNITQAMSFLRLKNEYKTDFIPAYLFIFLQSKFGKIQLNRHARPTGQYNLNNEELGAVRVIKLDISVQEKIEELVNISLSTLIESNQFYQSAQNLLLEHLGLKDFNPPTQTVNIKSFADSFGTSGRLDAEFYQEKYDVLVQKLKAQEYDELKNLVSVKKSIEPGSSAYDEQGLPFIRVSDYDKFQISSPAKYLSEVYCRENHETLKNLLPKKGTILFSKDGTVGIAHLLSEDLNGISSGAILHLKVKDKRVLPEYLTLVLNSFAVQMQAERDVGGSIIQHWRVEEIKEVVIPIISMEIQTQIADLIRQSDRLRQKSQALLEEAKRKVEQAIEG